MARRVNTRFLIILTVVVIGAGITALVVAKLQRADPEKHVNAARAYAAQGKWEEALRNYHEAVRIDAKQPAVLVEYGDALSQMAGRDPENMNRARNAWQAALELDPSNQAALSRNVALFKSYLELGPQSNLAGIVSQGRAFAERLAQADPANVDAAAMAQVFTIRGWIYGVQTDEQRVAEALDRLAELVKQHPARTDLIYQFAIGKLAQAESVARSQPALAQARAGEAEAAIDAGLKAQPESAAMHFRASDLYSRLARLTADAEKRKSYAAAAKANIEKAMTLAKPDDELYAEIHMTNATLAWQSNDRERAEKIARELLAKRENDPAVRLQVATLLAEDPAKRKQAIEILDRPIPADAFTGNRVHLAGPLEVNTLIRLIGFRLDEFAAATGDEAAREKLLPKIEDGLSKLMTRVGLDKPIVLRLRGKLQRLQGQHVAAIQSLSKAIALMDQADAPRDGAYYETVDLLARSYLDTQQTGPARELLTQIVSRVENYVPARIMLATLLLRQRDLEAARPHIEYLEKLAPNAPEVLKMRLMTLDRERDKDAIKQVYAKLPETTPAEMLDKANTAHALGEFADAERLLGAVLEQQPASPDASALLARNHAAQGQREKAAEVIDAALAQNPQHMGLQLLKKQLANASPEELRKFRAESIEQITDPTQKAIQLSELAASEGKADEALRHLKDAEQSSPENLRIKEALLNHYLARQQWDEAQRYVETLAKANQDQAGGLLYRVRLAMARGDINAALNYGREVTQKLPEFGQTWLGYAQALQAAGQLEEATQRYATALEKQPDNFDAMRGMVECYFRLNRPSDAKRYIDAALKRQPNHPYFVEQLTNWEVSFGDPSKAVAQREAALKQNPQDPQAWLNAGQTYLAAARTRAKEGERKELLAKASDTFKGAVERFPDEPGFYRQLADTLLALGDADAGQAALEQLAARDAWKDKPEPQYWMAEYLARAGKLDQAEALLRAAAEKDPKNVQAQLMLASLLSQRGKVDEALKALEANADDPRVLRQRIELQITSNKLDDADQTLQAALAKDPKSIDLLALSGYVNMARGQWEDAPGRPGAASRLLQALELDPKNLTAQYYLGLVRLNQPTPNIDEAVQRLSAVREQNPQHLDARFWLAQAYARRNENENAARELEAALQLQPANKRIRMTLLNLYMSVEPKRLVDAERTIREGRALAKDDPDLMRAEAVMWVARKEPQKAIAAARQAVAAAPKDPGVLSKFLEILIDSREYATASKEASQMIAADAQRWWAYMYRGVAKRYSSDKDGALSDFEAALTAAGNQGNQAAAQEVIKVLAREIGVDEALARIAPLAEKENRWRLVASQLYQAKGSYDRAAEMVERVLADGEKLSPGEREIALRLAGGLYLLYRPQPLPAKAYDAYLKLLDMRPTDIGSLNNMACLLAETMNPPRTAEALKYSQKAYQLMTEAGIREPLIMDTHGWVLTLNDRPNEGIDVLRQAASIRSFPELHYHLGEAYLKTAAPEDAQKQLELAAEQLRQAEENNKDVDPYLRARVENALARAKELLRSKSAAASP